MNRLLRLGERALRGRPPVGSTPHDVVFKENKWRLLRYRSPGVRFKTPIVMVPSLINRHYVLDLLPGKSLVEWLVAQGHDVYVIDWGTPGDEDRFVTMDAVCDRWVGRAVRVAAKASGAERVHLLGYCLGGTIAAIYAALHPSALASLTALAAPIRFKDEGLLSKWTTTPEFDVDALVDAWGNVPWQLMQGAFQLLRPTLNLSKSVHAIDRALDDEFLDGFFALETWGNDNVSFPGEFYRKYITELYRGDALALDRFTIASRDVRLGAITCPTFAITFEHDNIVPWESARVLVDRVGAKEKEWLHLSGGHVGAVVSRGAVKKLWPALAKFWQKYDVTSRADAEARRAPRAPLP